MRSLLVSILGISLFLIHSDSFALKKTNGTPIGGMGTGYVVYNAVTGDFGTSGKAPPAGADGFEFASGRKSSSSGFHLFAGGEAVQKATTEEEDAKCPIYTADFGEKNSVSFKLTAFGPYIPGDGMDNFQLATSPLAFFEIVAVNNGSAATDVAAAMEFSNTAGSGSLLGGATSGTAESGNQAISFAGTDDNACLAVDCDATTPGYSCGAMGTFTTNGTLSNGAGNIVAAKCNLAAGATVRFKFTLAWWRKYESTTDRYSSGYVDRENYYYHNFYDDSKEALAFGRSKFDAVRTAITSFVERTMASNFPEWYKDRLLNNTYPLIHNSQVARDGRLAFWEGLYGIIGTIDQGEHAALFYTFNWPQVQWLELQYWKRTSWQDSKKGQIHHDFNMGIQGFNNTSIDENTRKAARFMCPWDSWNRNDYWWVPNTTTWSDLNSMFIFKAYELMLATGNLDSMRTYFPAIKATADRIIAQSNGGVLPLTCHSTYDESNDGGATFSITPEYNAGIALPTYLAMAEIAKFTGHDSVATRYMEYYTTGRPQYKTQYANSSTYATGKDYSEGDVAGYSWANYLCFEPVMDSGFITDAKKKLWNYYHNRTESGVDDLRAKLGKWGFYTCDHWGGVEIALGKPDTALIIHKWDHQYYYEESPAMIFWQTLRKESGTNKNSYASYMTGPTVWRSYFQMIGYMIDNANNRLWIRPRIPTDMDKKITNAILLNPKGHGTLNYDETGDAATGLVQDMTVEYDSPVTVKEIVLKDNAGVAEPYVSVGGTLGHTVALEGSGYEKNIRVTLAAPIQIGPQGVRIQVFNKPTGVAGAVRPSRIRQLAIKSFRLGAGGGVRFSVDKAGPVTMELLAINGAWIGTIMQKNAIAGEQSFIWNGRTIDGKRVGSVLCLMRLTTPDGSITRTVFTGR